MQTRLVVVAVLISTLMSGQSRTTGGSTPADIVYGKPGQLVAVDGSRLNLADHEWVRLLSLELQSSSDGGAAGRPLERAARLTWA